MKKSKLAKLAKYGAYHAKTFAIDLNLSKGNSEYRKFVVLAVSRSGSNLLRDLLNAHSQTMMFGELFRRDDSISWDCPVNDQLKSDTKRVTHLLRTDPVALLRDDIFGPTAGHIKALGFKLFYYHAQSEHLRPIWSWLREQDDIRIIQLRRRNSLKRFLSLVKAEKTNVWRDASGKRGPNESLSLDYERCRKSFEEVRQWEMEYSNFFRDHDRIEVVYEDLARDYVGNTRRIQSFLGLPNEDVKPTIYKQSTTPLSESISNYDELKARFSSTPWAEYFEDE